MEYSDKRIRLMIVIVVLAIAAAYSGCDIGGSSGSKSDTNTDTNTSGLHFESDAELASYLKEQYAESVQPTDVRNYKAGIIEADAVAAAEDTGGENAGFSGTNLQEAGVDESDMVKTDGAFLYVAGNEEVRIVPAVPADGMTVSARIPVDGLIDSLYLHGRTLVILYNPSLQNPGAPVDDTVEKIDMGIPCWIPVEQKTGIRIVDVANPASPVTIKDIRVDGWLSASRLTGGKLHVITQHLPNLPLIDIWYDGSENDREQLVQKNSQMLDSLTLDDLLPSYEVFDSDGTEMGGGRLVATPDFLRPENPGGGTTISIVTVDMANPKTDFTSIGFVGDVHHVYASPQSLYLVSTVYNNQVEIGPAMVPSTFQTRIYQFDLGVSPVTFSAEGQVDGELLNQFSLGEYEKVLRIATTTGYVWDGSSENHVFCLKNKAEKLEVIGRLDNLAPGERLYAARFTGQRGFLVTFVQIDPLFTLDLSDPEHPAVLGELKVPGYSTYLHPIDDNHLLAIGKDTILDNGTPYYQGVQLSIFDISDFANPTLLHSEPIGDRGTESEALYNHKAFTFWPVQNLIALPIDLYEYPAPPASPWDYGQQTFNGLYVYRLSPEKKLERLGRISMEPDDLYYWGWLRGLFIDDHVYAVNAQMVKAAPIDAIEEPFQMLVLGGE